MLVPIEKTFFILLRTTLKFSSSLNSQEREGLDGKGGGGGTKNIRGGFAQCLNSYPVIYHFLQKR